jgi:dihydrofolate reductase
MTGNASEQEIDMGKLVVSEFITLDGVIEDPGGSGNTEHGGWSFRHPAPEGQQFKFDELQASDVQLLGRVTYEGFAAAWPAMEESTGAFGQKMNAKLKQRYDGDILVAGSAESRKVGPDVLLLVYRPASPDPAP